MMFKLKSLRIDERNTLDIHKNFHYLSKNFPL